MSQQPDVTPKTDYNESLRNLGGNGEPIEVPAELARGVQNILSGAPRHALVVALNGSHQERPALEWLINSGALTQQQYDVLGQLFLSLKESGHLPKGDTTEHNPLLGRLLQNTQALIGMEVRRSLGWSTSLDAKA